MELSAVHMKKKDLDNSLDDSSISSRSQQGFAKKAGITRVYADAIDRLPLHVIAECTRLKKSHENGTALTEPECRPLVHSVCIWLLHKGVTNKIDHPDVIAKVWLVPV